MIPTTPIVAAFHTLGLSASDTPAGPLVGCPVCNANLNVKAKAVICLDCKFTAVGETWEIAALAKAALPKAKKEEEEEFPYHLMGDESLDNPPPLPEELIPGLLARGNKFVIGGSAKFNKTWSLIHLGLALSEGVSWWGYTVPRKCRVLYLNLEIQREYFIDRVNKIRAAMGVDDRACTMEVIHLRGLCDDHSRLLPEISEFLKSIGSDQYDVIIIDPLYKMLHGSESDQQFMSAVVDSIEKFGMRHGAVTIYGAHFAKGDQWNKPAIERIAGSGVGARDGDTVLCVTKLPGSDDKFVVDTVTRNFAPVPTRGLRWVFPFMRHDPTVCVDPGAKAGLRS